MRADRLLSILMLLQSRGKITAEALAVEMEVSVRTIYRDMDALSASGVPVYCERGPGGGCALLDDYRTHLTGLTVDEMQALFAMSIPSPLAELGIAQPLKAAMRKLEASLPTSTETNRASQRIIIDWKGWKDTAEQVPLLSACQQAVWQDCKLRIQSRTYVRDQLIESVVDPYALAAKAGAWYLVVNFEGVMRVFRLRHLVSAQVLPETFERSQSFELNSFWEKWCERTNVYWNSFKARVRIAPSLIPVLHSVFKAQADEIIAQAGEPDAQGWREVTLTFNSFTSARSYLLGFGAAAEVLAPKALRLSVIDYAAQISKFYTAEQ